MGEAEHLGSAGSRPLVVLLSAVGWSGVRGSERQLSESLVRNGADVLWVDPPVSMATPGRYLGSDGVRPWRPTLRRTSSGVVRLTPVALPGWTRPGVRVFNAPLVRAQIGGAIRRSGRQPVALIGCTPSPIPARWFPDALRVLYGTDDWVAGADLLKSDRDRLVQHEQAALTVADIVLAISPELRDRWQESGRREVVSFPNGCDVAAFAAVPEPPHAPSGPVVGLVGQLNNRIDLTLLEAVAAKGVELLLVGPHEPTWEPARCADLFARPNVRHTGAVPYDELPVWYARIDLGLTPYRDTGFNRASSPLKTLEYLAAGRPVVSTDLPASRRLVSEGADVHIVADGGPGAYAEAVVERARRPTTSAETAARRAVVQRHSWDNRGAELLALIVDRSGSVDRAQPMSNKEVNAT